MKLYWRYKKDGVWTWKPVEVQPTMVLSNSSLGRLIRLELEEEE